MLKVQLAASITVQLALRKSFRNASCISGNIFVGESFKGYYCLSVVYVDNLKYSETCFEQFLYLIIIIMGFSPLAFSVHGQLRISIYSAAIESRIGII